MATKLTDKQKSMLGSVATGLSSGVGLGTSLAQIDDTSGQETLIKGVGNTQFDTGDTNTLMASFDANNMARTNYTADEIRGFTPGQMAGSIIGNTATSMLGSNSFLEAGVRGGLTLAGGVFGALAGNAKAQKRAAELNSLAEENNRIYLNNFANAASNTQNKMFNKSLLNIAAEGGFLDGDPTDWDSTLSGRLISYTENRDSVGFNPATRRWYAPKGVGYDPNNRGMGVDINYLPKGVSLHTDSNGTYLTEEEERAARYAKLEEANNSYNQRLKYAQKVIGSTNVPSEYKKALVMDAIYNLGAGNVANVLFEDRELMNTLLNGTDEEFRTYIQQYWDSNSSKVVKPRAERIKMQNVFLDTQKAYGGPLFNHGGDWSNGLTFINEGGTHEQNPLGGVPVGVDQEGTPNLVEEGEIIWNDYVFSNRLKPTKKQLETVGFNPKYEGYTFAKIVEDVQKASAENPLDKISTDTLNENLMYLMTMQEETRMKKEAKKNKFKYGGKFGNVFEGPGGDANILGHLYETEEEAAEAQRLIEEESALLNAIADQEALAIGNRTQEYLNDYFRILSYPTKESSTPKSENPFVNAGTIAPLISSAGQLIYNTLKPIDKSNVIAAKSYSKVPMMSLPRVGGKKSFKPTDKNQYIAPIIAQGNSTARALQNSGVNAYQTSGSLLANNYNTQRAIAEGLNAVDQADFAKEMQVGQFNLGIDQANLNASQAEQNANIIRANKLADAELKDAQTIEALGQLKGQAINASLNTLTKGIADLATQGINWNLIKDNPAYSDAIKHLYGKQAKCGGMLTRKKKK